MKRNFRNALIACGLVLAGAFGVASAAGGYAYEYEYYDSAGNLVGIRGYDCAAGRYRWGFVTENAVFYDYGPCGDY